MSKYVDLLFIQGWSVSEEFYADWLHGLSKELMSNRSIKIVACPERGDIRWLEHLAKEYVSPNTVIIGWSLGGMLAIKLAAYLEGANKSYDRLVTLMSSPKFVESTDYQCGMKRQDFADFVSSISDDRAIVKTFPFLCIKGAPKQSSLLKRVREQYDLCLLEESNRCQSLKLLGELDVQQELANLTQSALMIFGDQDVLVKQSCALEIKSQFTHHKSVIIDGVAHFPFVDSVGQVLVSELSDLKAAV
ncbi:hypothetical protein A3762_05185 [Oleiphilus sp. HI0125]|uniref:hypothetical protein n=2 Tax=Oleiphilus sp. HI0125 TaxID=1822266 RepID=UPI0007C230E8|nr:hypothetical protein [Oleiphilus sp. HI0125]KZZ59360.1 hypothetical protein A3762_05185 [Oleiphilus sp. HI0125]